MSNSTDRIERAIVAAREVAATAGAKELRRTSDGTAGTWDAGDEARLREGWIRIWDPHRKRWDRFDIKRPK